MPSIDTAILISAISFNFKGAMQDLVVDHCLIFLILFKMSQQPSTSFILSFQSKWTSKMRMGQSQEICRFYHLTCHLKITAVKSFKMVTEHGFMNWNKKKWDENGQNMFNLRCHDNFTPASLPPSTLKQASLVNLHLDSLLVSRLD